MSVANIWKLQGNTAALCRKISQNVGWTYREVSGEHHGTVQNGYETLRVNAIRGSGYVWPGKLKHPPLPSGVKRRVQNIRMECRQRRIPDVRHPGGMSAEQNSGCETSRWNGSGENSGCDTSGWNVGALLSHLASGAGCEISGWNVGREEFRMWDIREECRRSRIPDVRHLGGMSTEQNSGCDTSGWNVGALPYPDSLREKHTTLAIITPRTIAYPIQICCPDHWLKCTSLATSFRQPATAHVPPPFDGVSERSVRTSFVMDSKELSSISDCFGDQKAIKIPKLNTIWLELIARVLNMLIGLKCDNYYSKVFKRVNYKLWNSTFWVVIKTNYYLI